MKNFTFFLRLIFFGFFMLFCSGWVMGQLVQQNFSGSTTVSDYFHATIPANGQFNAISTSGVGVVLSINTTTSNKLRFARAAANTGSYSRTTDFSPTPTSLIYRFDLTVSGNSIAQTTSAVWQVGSGFGTANSAESNADVHSRIGLNLTATNGQFSIRRIDVTAANSANYSGTQTLTWVINNSGNTLSYRAPDGSTESIADDRWDLWIGTTKEFDEQTVTTSTQTLTDLKFAFSAGTGTVDIDNILIDPIPVMPTSTAATSINTTSFIANWSTVSGVSGYRLDVATDAGFTSFVSGFNNLYVSGQGASSKLVEGLTANTTYWYRVRSASQYSVGEFASGNSSAQNTTTSAPTITSTASGNWADGSTWVGGVAPATTDNVVIVSGHTVTVGAGITRDAGTTTTVNTGGILATEAAYTNNGTTTINGTFQINQGGLASGTDIVYGSSSTLIYNNGAGGYTTSVEWPTSDAPYNVEVSNSTPVTVESTKQLTISGTLTNNAGSSIVVQSDASRSGSLIIGTYSGSGTFTYQRYMTGSKWHMTGSPLSGQAIDGTFLSTNFNAGMKHYNEGDNSFVGSYNGSEGNSLTLGKGYAAKRNSDGEASYIGTPNTTTPTITLTKALYGWNLLANPYTSAISVSSLISANSDNLHASFASLYIWDETGTYDGSQNYYRAVSLDGYYPTTSLTHLQVGQAFFVRARNGGESFQITPAMQSHQPSAIFKSDPITDWKRIILNAEISSAKASTRISYLEDMSNGLDVGYDAGLLNSYPTFALYTKLLEDNGNKFMVQCLPTDFENLVVPIGLDAKAGEIVKFTAQNVSLPEDYKVFLEDRTLGVFTNLSEENAEYSIQLLTESKGTGRFFVRTSIGSALGIDDLDTDSPFKVFTRSNHNQIVIRGEANANTAARIYNVAGKQVANIHLKQSNENLVQFTEEAGVYIVKISNEKGTTTQKFVWVK